MSKSGSEMVGIGEMVPVGIVVKSALANAPIQQGMVDAIQGDPRYKVVCQGAYPALALIMDEGSMPVKVAGGSLLTRTPNMSVACFAEGGCLNAISLCCCMKHTSCCMSKYSSLGGTAEAVISPPLPGDLAHCRVSSSSGNSKTTKANDDVVLLPGVYMAADDTTTAKCALLPCCGLTGLCCMGGCCGVRVQGDGNVFFAGFGSTGKYLLAPGAKRKFDTGYLIGWSAEGLKTSCVWAGDGCYSSCMSGECCAIQLENVADVERHAYMQTRNVKQFAKVLAKYMGSQQQGNQRSRKRSPNSGGGGGGFGGGFGFGFG